MSNLLELLQVYQISNIEIYEFFKKLIKEHPAGDISRQINNLVCMTNNDFAGLYFTKNEHLEKIEENYIYKFSRYNYNFKDARIILPDPVKTSRNPLYINAVKINKILMPGVNIEFDKSKEKAKLFYRNTAFKKQYYLEN